MRDSQSETEGAEILRLSDGFMDNKPSDLPSEPITSGGRLAVALHAEVSS